MIELPDVIKPYQKIIGATVALLAVLYSTLSDFSVDGDDAAKIAAAAVLWLSVFYPTNHDAE